MATLPSDRADLSGDNLPGWGGGFETEEDTNFEYRIEETEATRHQNPEPEGPGDGQNQKKNFKFKSEVDE